MKCSVFHSGFKRDNELPNLTPPKRLYSQHSHTTALTWTLQQGSPRQPDAAPVTSMAVTGCRPPLRSPHAPALRYHNSVIYGGVLLNPAGMGKPKCTRPSLAVTLTPLSLRSSQSSASHRSPLTTLLSPSISASMPASFRVLCLRLRRNTPTLAIPVRYPAEHDLPRCASPQATAPHSALCTTHPVPH